MAQTGLMMFSLFKDSYRLFGPGYGPGPGLKDGTLGGLGKVMIDVLVGDKYALVWDTGYGDMELKQFIRENITDKPLIVVNSHGHGGPCRRQCPVRQGLDQARGRARAGGFHEARHAGP